jgi:hypothetical protein
VEVSAAPPLLNTTNATVAGLVEGQQVSTLPLNGRDITNLVLMQPGMNYEVDSSFSFEGFVASNGNRGTTGSSYLDNSDTSDNELGGGQFTNFNLDAIAEFKVLQNNYSAEFGRGSGEIVQLVTKQGTTRYTGACSSLSETAHSMRATSFPMLFLLSGGTNLAGHWADRL